MTSCTLLCVGIFVGIIHKNPKIDCVRTQPNRPDGGKVRCALTVTTGLMSYFGHLWSEIAHDWVGGTKFSFGISRNVVAKKGVRHISVKLPFLTRNISPYNISWGRHTFQFLRLRQLMKRNNEYRLKDGVVHAAR